MKHSKLYTYSFLLALIIVLFIVFRTSVIKNSYSETIGFVDESANSDYIVENAINFSLETKQEYEKLTDDIFIKNMADFSIEIFKKTISPTENSLVSPLSIMLALAMTANGADGETLFEMERLLAGSASISDLNDYLHSFTENLPSIEKSKLEIANSIWIRDDGSLTIVPDFLQTAIDFYKATINKSSFDIQTLNDINDWVKSNTDGLITEIIERIERDDIMFLINAVVFDAEWMSGYEESDVRKRDFTNKNGNVVNIDFMHSEEGLYIENNMVIGFRKPYIHDHYSFVALLPKQDVNIEEYIYSLTGESFINTLENSYRSVVRASMPKFEFEYDIILNSTLMELGIPLAFNEHFADFKKMATSRVGNIFISKVQHKTFISVDEIGTKAAAATSVTMTARSVPPPPKIVHLDRPYVFAIIDNKTNVPIFIGTIMAF
ncbi:MAG: serpin family protein [Candidatus Cloacimonetes bacterium]|nr:serpin family protein [Candidatus Cloacimonadota bacterium]